MIAASSFSGVAFPGPASAQATAPAAAHSPAAVIDSFDSTLLDVMKQATSLGYDGRYAKFDPAIRRTFDIPLMTRIVVGAPWSGWTDAQRTAITDAFTKFIVATYARRFDGYGGESFTVNGTQNGGTGTVVLTTLNRPKDSPVTINYLMHQGADGSWKAVDVFLTGSISELATRRSEFASVLERGGYDGLLAELQNKSKPDSTN